MKKFYSVLALAAACLSAQAADIKPATAVVYKTASEVVLENASAPAQEKAPAYAPASNMAELQGLYPGGTFDMPFDGYKNQTGDFAVVPTEGNKILFFGITDTPIPGTVDFATSTINLDGKLDLGEKNFGGTTGTRQVILKHYRINSAGKLEDHSTTPFPLSIVDGGIKSADPNDVYMGEIQGAETWMVTGGYKFNMTKQEEENTAQWYTTGEATFNDDGWFLPWFNWEGMGIQAPTLTCQFQRSSQDENIVALYDVYGGLNDWMHSLGATFDLVDGNLPGRVVFNISNKKCVYVPYTYLTVSGELFYCTNTEATQIEEGTTPQELIDFLGEENVSNYDEANKTMTIKNCMITTGQFRNTNYKDLYPQWGLAADDVTCTVTIMLPEVESGIQNITVDANAPVEYYNLQGIRVENPSKGLYIKRQGNTATKVVL